MTEKLINNDIIHTHDINIELKRIISEYKHSKFYLLTDDNCKKYCYPIIKENLPKDTHIKIIKAGEQNKNLKTLTKIWEFLIQNNADRNSILINLGGGVVSDIGGFAASTFKRGMRFINIPTSLLAQTDAAIGGKTGFNFQSFKNEIGIINQPEKIFISHEFLKTLPKDEYLSGFAEMLKHAFIFDKNHYEELKQFAAQNYNIEKIQGLIEKSVKIKEHFIKNDLNDLGIRQTLNFGHTFGHAFESYYNDYTKTKIKHGTAVAFGMICELSISKKIFDFPQEELNDIETFIFKIFSKINIPKSDTETIYKLMLHDKKNTSGIVNCVLLKKLGEPVINNKIGKDEILDALNIFLK